MPATFDAEIIEQNGVVFSGPVQRVRVPAHDGSFGVLARHAPMVAEVAIGEVVLITADGRERHFAVGGGVCEIGGNRLRLLVRSAEAATDIVVARARAAERRARDRLQDVDHRHDSIVDFDRAQLALLRAINRLRVATGPGG